MPQPPDIATQLAAAAAIPATLAADADPDAHATATPVECLSAAQRFLDNQRSYLTDGEWDGYLAELSQLLARLRDPDCPAVA